MRAGVIDIGSNSIKLLIGEIDEKSPKGITILESLKNIVPIGKSTFFEGDIAQEDINQIIGILEKYKKVLAAYDVTTVKVIATTAVREAGNREIFLDTLQRKTGLMIEVLSVGDVIYYINAYMSYKLKDSYPIHTKNLIIAEIGAGSLDISVLRKGFTVMNLGLPLGTLRLKQLMGKLDGSQEEVLEAVQEHIETEMMHFKKMFPKIQIDDVILIDENYVYLQSLLATPKKESDFFQYTDDDAKNVLAELVDKTPEEIAKTYKIPREVAETLNAYTIMLNNFFTLTENKYIYISEASLSGAILANILLDLELSEKYNKQNQLISVAKFFCQKFGTDLDHVQHVAHLSGILFNHFKDLLGLKENEFLFLVLAAYLHDIGILVNNRSHHKHSEYIINALNLFQLTDEEVKIIACVARYHRRAGPQKSHLIYNSLDTEDKILVQKLSALLRIANALDRSHKQKIKSIDVRFNKAQDVTLVVEASVNCLLEKSDFVEKKKLFEEVTGSKINLAFKS